MWTPKPQACPMTDLARSFKHLSSDEALHALYIDFEGEKDEPPVLLGVLRHAGRGSTPFVHQDVVDEAFAGLAGSVMSLHDAVEKAVRRAERADRRIVSWSEHDLKVVRTLAAEDPALVVRFEGRYANARAVAEFWTRRGWSSRRTARTTRQPWCSRARAWAPGQPL